ncbi:MAG: phage tail fiber protein [Natronomonas sp.]
MSDLAEWFEQAVQDWAFEGTDMPTAPTNQYIALHDSDPGSDGSTGEISAASYSRYEASPSDWSVSGSEPTTVTNDVDLEFGVAQENWGSISHVSIWDGSGGSDNCLWKGSLTESKAVGENDEFVIRAGDATFDLD